MNMWLTDAADGGWQIGLSTLPGKLEQRALSLYLIDVWPGITDEINVHAFVIKTTSRYPLRGNHQCVCDLHDIIGKLF